MKKRMAKALALLMCLMTAVAFMPTFAFAADGDGITVYLTVSDQGKLATANDGSPMAWKEVKVTDIDGDGQYTFDDALAAAHRDYNSAEGYAGGSSVSKLWGTQTYNCWFSVNGKGIGGGPSSKIVKDKDYLTAQINKDNELYADWFAKFDQPSVTIKEGSSVELSLSGFMGMTDYMDDSLKKIEGVDVGVWSKGQLSNAVKTDSEGKASISFDKAGTYVVSAEGAVEAEFDGTATYTLEESTRDKDNRTVYGKTDWSTMTSLIGYTAQDHGDGPYPWSEIQWMDLEDFDADEWDYENSHLLYSGNILWDSPIMAAACIVTVEHKDLEHKTVAAGKLQNGYECDICSGCGETVNYVAIPGYSDNYVKSFRVSKAKKSIYPKWKKQSKKNRKKFSGYQLRYSTNPGMEGASYVNAGKTSRGKKIKKLQAKTKYYVQVRSYTDNGGERYYAGWSKIKAVKTR